MAILLTVLAVAGFIVPGWLTLPPLGFVGLVGLVVWVAFAAFALGQLPQSYERS
jgi:hypothetical protein